MTTMSALAMLALILLVLGVYWLPSILARARRHPDLVPIVLVNALLGWTVVGWVWTVAKLARGGSGRRLQYASAAAAPGGEQTGRRRTDARDGDLVKGIGTVAAPVPLEP